MPKISKTKRSRISEQILIHLFSTAPESLFTSAIAKEIARDEEFTKLLLEELETHKLVVRIKKGPQGQDYQRWERWRMSQEAFEVYKNINSGNL
jgi:hypothetical protein